MENPKTQDRKRDQATKGNQLWMMTFNKIKKKKKKIFQQNFFVYLYSTLKTKLGGPISFGMEAVMTASSEVEITQIFLQLQRELCKSSRFSQTYRLRGLR